MDRAYRSRLVGGALLVLAGVVLLALRTIPELRVLIQIEYSWPLIIVAVGVFLLLMGLLTGNPEMAVPACIVGGVGGILYWQNASENFGSWAYAWTLIPAFVGTGMILSGLLGGTARQKINEGIWMIVMGLTLFLVFGGLFGGLDVFGPYWPVLLILLGIMILVRTLLRSRS